MSYDEKKLSTPETLSDRLISGDHKRVVDTKDEKKRSDPEPPFDITTAQHARAVDAKSAFTGIDRDAEKKAKDAEIAKAQGRQRQRWLPNHMRERALAREKELSTIRDSSRPVRTALTASKFSGSEQGQYPLNETTKETRVRWKTEVVPTTTSTHRESKIKEDHDKAATFKAVWQAAPNSIESERKLIQENLKQKIATFDKDIAEAKKQKQRKELQIKNGLNNEHNEEEKHSKEEKNSIKVTPSEKTLDDSALPADESKTAPPAPPLSKTTDEIIRETRALQEVKNEFKKKIAALNKNKTDAQTKAKNDEENLDKRAIKLDSAIVAAIYPEYTDAKGTVHSMSPKCGATLYLGSQDEKDISHGTKTIVFDNTEEKIGIVYGKDKTNQHQSYIYHQKARVIDYDEDKKEIEISPEKVTEQIISSPTASSLMEAKRPSQVYYQETLAGETEPHIQRQSIFNQVPDVSGREDPRDHSELNFVEFVPDEKDSLPDQEKKRDDFIKQCEQLSTHSHYNFVVITQDQYFLIKEGTRTNVLKAVALDIITPSADEKKQLRASLSSKNKKQLKQAKLWVDVPADESTQKKKDQNKDPVISQRPSEEGFKLLKYLQSQRLIKHPDLRQEANEQFLIEKIEKPDGSKSDQLQHRTKDSGTSTPTYKTGGLYIPQHLDLQTLNIDSPEQRKRYIEDFGADFDCPEAVDTDPEDYFDILGLEEEFAPTHKPHPLDKMQIRPYFDQKGNALGSVFYEKSHTKDDPIFTKLQREAKTVSPKMVGNKKTYSLPESKRATASTNSKVTLTDYTETTAANALKSSVLTRRYQGFDTAGNSVDFFEVDPDCQALLRQSQSISVQNSLPTRETDTTREWKRPSVAGNSQLQEYLETKGRDGNIIKRVWKGKNSEGRNIEFSDNGPNKRDSIEKQIEDPRDASKQQQFKCRTIISETSTYHPGVKPQELVKQKMKERHSEPETVLGSAVPVDIRDQFRPGGKLNNMDHFGLPTSPSAEVLEVTRKRTTPNQFTGEAPLALMEYREQKANPDTYTFVINSREVKDPLLSQTWIGQDITGKVYQFTEYDPTFELFVRQSDAYKKLPPSAPVTQTRGGQTITTFENPGSIWGAMLKPPYFEAYTEATDDTGKITSRTWKGVDKHGNRVSITSTKEVKNVMDFLKPDTTPFVPPKEPDPVSSPLDKGSPDVYRDKKHQLVQENLRPKNNPAPYLQVQTNRPELQDAASVCNGLTHFLQTSGTFEPGTNSPYAKFADLKYESPTKTPSPDAQTLALSLLGFKQPTIEKGEKELKPKHYQQAFADGVRELKADLSALRQRLQHAEQYRNTHGEQRFKQEIRDINAQTKALYARCDRIFNSPLEKALALCHHSGDQGLDKRVHTTRPLVTEHKSLNGTDNKTDEWTVVDEHDQEFTFNNLDLEKLRELNSALVLKHDPQITKDTRAAIDHLDNQRRFYKEDIKRRMSALGIDIDLVPRYGQDYNLLHRIANGFSDLITGTTVIPCAVTRDNNTYDMQLIIKNGQLSVHICAYDDKGKYQAPDPRALAAMLHVVKANKKPFEKTTLFWNSTSIFDKISDGIFGKNIPKGMAKIAREAVKQYETDLKQQYQNEGKLPSWAEHKAAMDAMLVDHSDITKDQDCPLLIDMIQRFENNPNLADCPVIYKDLDTFTKAHNKFKDYLQHHFKLKAIEMLVEQLSNQGMSEQEITTALGKLDKDPTDPANYLEIPEDSDKLNGWVAGKSVATWLQEQVDTQANKFQLNPPGVTPPIPSAYDPKNKTLTVTLRTHAGETTPKEADAVRQQVENVRKTLEAEGKKVHQVIVNHEYVPETLGDMLTTLVKLQDWRANPRGPMIAKENAKKLELELNHKHTADTQQRDFNKAVTEDVGANFGFGRVDA